MLEDYSISEKLRYENHRLVVVGTDVQISGVLGAALLSALLVDTEEGGKRGIAIDSAVEKRAWIAKYEREVRREEWGLLGKETDMLSEAYMDLSVGEMELSDLCPNVLLLDLAQGLVVTYMRYLTTEYYRDHIWECCSWKAPFAQWLMDAAHIETLRQRFLQTDWTDAVSVTEMAVEREQPAEPMFVFEGEASEDILKRYFKWLWSTYQSMVREQPGAKPRAAKHRTYVVEEETNWLFMQDEVFAMSEENQQLWGQWMRDWEAYINKQLKPEKPLQFWEKEVDEERRRQLTQVLRMQEKEWDYFKCLSAAIYALRQLGYVRRGCSVRDITRWMSEELVKDYTTKNNHDQFARAWKELSRYAEEVRHFVDFFASYGVRSLRK